MACPSVSDRCLANELWNLIWQEDHGYKAEPAYAGATYTGLEGCVAPLACRASAEPMYVAPPGLGARPLGEPAFVQPSVFPSAVYAASAMPGFVQPPPGLNLPGWAQGQAGQKAPPADDCEEERPQQARRQCQLRIATRLREVEQADADCVIFARKVNRLGFRSDHILKEHYSRYGPVEKVLLSNEHQRTWETPASVRVRPSGLALIVMRRPADAAKVLAAGEVQMVNGVGIRLRRFQRRESIPTAEDAAAEHTATSCVPSFAVAAKQQPVHGCESDDASTRSTLQSADFSEISLSRRSTEDLSESPRQSATELSETGSLSEVPRF